MAISKRLRFLILQRDGFRCCYCGRGPRDGEVLHVDHVRPVSRGGRDDPENLKTSCAPCNMGKSNIYRPPIAYLDEYDTLEFFESSDPRTMVVDPAFGTPDGLVM